MAQAAITDERPAGIQRGRGGFLRNSADVPYVSDPSGALVKSGPRKGEPKRVPYGSPSNRSKQIENTTNLVKWGERRVVLGIGADPELLELCGQLIGLDVDSDEYKTLADSIILRAKEAAEANLAAARGSFGHVLSEDFDEGRDWLQRAEAGEDLGLDREVQAALVAAWQDMLTRTGLEILAVEASCVDDRWRLAGTLDRIARTTQPLTFALPGGELRTIPAGTVLVLDIKSGKRRTGRAGEVLYWHGYAIQIASYAQSVPYDTEAETRGEWPWPISQEHALIAHLDVLAAIDGEARCDLVYVDLVAGREHGGECVVTAKAWEARTDVFSVAHLETSAASPVAAEPVSVAPPIATDTTSEGQGSAHPVPAPRSPADEVEAVRSRPAPDEGDNVVDPTYDVLMREYLALGKPERAWIASLTEQATQGGVSFHSKGHRTVRRYEIIRALVLIAQGGIDERTEPSTRLALEAVIGDVAQFPSVPLGHLVGSLSAAEAARFAGIVDGTFALAFTSEGRPTLRPAA